MAHKKTGQPPGHAGKAEGHGFLSSNSVLMGLGGLLDPEVEKWGDRIGQKIPDQYKTETMRRLIGLIKNYIQGMHMHGVPGLLVDRLVDVADFAFRKGGGAGDHETRTRKIEDWQKSFMDDARKRMAASTNKAATIAEIREEYSLYKSFYNEALDIQGEHGEEPPEEPFDWGPIDRWLGQMAFAMQDRFPGTRPKAIPARTVGASGLPPIGSSYGNDSEAGGAKALAGTLFRGVDEGFRRFYNSVGTLFLVLLVVAGWIAASLWLGLTGGVIIGVIVIPLLLAWVIRRWPLTTLVASILALLSERWNPTYSRFWRYLWAFLGTLLTFAILFLWWNPDCDVRWRHTIVLGVGAIFLFVAAGLHKPFFGGSHGHSHGSGGLGKAILALGVIAMFVLLCVWLMDRPSMASQSGNDSGRARTHTLGPGENLVLDSRDNATLVVPARMTEGACVCRSATARNFWTDPPNAKLQVARECDGRWMIESPTRTVADGRSLTCIGFRNPWEHDTRIGIHSST